MDAAGQRTHFETFGYVLVPQGFDPEPLSSEVRRALADGFAANGSHANNGPVGNSFQYVPMMTERTPISLGLVANLAELAVNLLGGSILPGRAKGTRYSGSTAWHRDADSPVRSIGMLCYLDPLGQDNGALQVVPGSQRRDADASIGSGPVEHGTDRHDVRSAVPLPTSPGDIVVLDEHVLHASSGGAERHQWRVDFVSDSGSDDAELTRYYASQHVVGWDGGYDVDLFPSYGRAWQDLNSQWTERLAGLGVFDLAQAEEAFVRDAWIDRAGSPLAYRRRGASPGM